MCTLIDDLDAFYLEHRRSRAPPLCELNSGGESELIWMTCSCGAKMVRSLYEITTNNRDKGQLATIAL